MASSAYVPALAYPFLTRWYDAVVRWTTRERRFRALLLGQMDVRPGQQVLDVGCGTGTFALMLKQAQPAARIVGLDGDAAVLDLARRKAAAAGAEIDWRHGSALNQPFPDDSFDLAASSLVFHHLDRAAKRAALREIHRVLKPGGALHVADWGRAANGLMRVAFLSVQALDGFGNTADNVAGLLPDFMREAGFADAREIRRLATPCGTLSIYRAAKPATPVRPAAPSRRQDP
ncbi:MAG: methyltransferase type 11 [Opitutus sp.]|nr:methyltransferase type 11 [Opitutus sp.]